MLKKFKSYFVLIIKCLKLVMSLNLFSLTDSDASHHSAFFSQKWDV